MRLDITVYDSAGESRDVIVLADPESDLEETLERVGVNGSVVVGGRAADPACTVAASPIHMGAVVAPAGVDAAAHGELPPTSSDRAQYELAVVSGIDAGVSYPLVDYLTIGRDPASDVMFDDSRVSRAHARVRVSDDGTIAIEDLQSSNGVIVDGCRIDVAARLRLGQPAEIGPYVVAVRSGLLETADVHPDGEGRLTFNRSARIRPAPPSRVASIPSRPTTDDSWPFPWSQAIAPLVFAGAMLLFFRRPEMLLFSLLSPVFTITNYVQTKRRTATTNARRVADYDEARRQTEARIAGAIADDLAYRWDMRPDPAAIAQWALTPTRRLWERRLDDDDALVLRIGTASLVAGVTIPNLGEREPPRLADAPVTVDLAAVGVLGIAGPSELTRPMTRWLVVQLAALRSPNDLRIVLLTAGPTEETAAAWQWVRWLPHVRNDDLAVSPCWIGNDAVSREERVKELLRLVEIRLDELQKTSSLVFSPSVVVVVEGVRALRSLAGVTRLLRDGPRVGIYVIGLDHEPGRLAAEGRARVVLDPSNPGVATLGIDNAATIQDVIVEGMGTDRCDRVARALSPLRAVGNADDQASLPGSLRFVDLAGIDPDAADAAARLGVRWTVAGRSTEAIVGVMSEGPFVLDLKRDGPHALVAGTTGAGKSEFLQTLAAALAVANSPDALNFILVDYKGGSAFADCARLPHTVGLVTNLDGHLTERALVSLDAELKRRERELAALGAPDVDAAWERAPDEAARRGLARLLLLVDEFAELVMELPDFVPGLIRVARVGRSLGVHLVLATQRPAGVVSGEMRANTNLRVALRMVDKAESAEVLESPHAASISRATPGRGFVRMGGAGGVREFQTARIAGRRRGVREGIPPTQAMIVPWSRVGQPCGLRPPPEPEGVETDLRALVERMGEAAASLGVGPTHSPLLPELATVVSLEALVEPGAFALEDIPAEHRQAPYCFDVVNASHLLVVGAARSGRSTALRSVAVALASEWSADDVHLYGVDMGNGMLGPLADLPHCGAVVGAAETDRVERLFERLAAEVQIRQELFARHGFGDINEQRAAVALADAAPLAYIVVLLDRWEGFLARFSPESGSELPAAVMRLVREGPNVGLRLVIAGDRSLLGDRLSSHIEEKLVLRLADRNDYRLVDIMPKHVPDTMPPGRALRSVSGTEMQIALPFGEASAQTQGQAIRAMAGRLAGVTTSPGRRLPFRVDGLPGMIDFEAAWGLVDADVRTESVVPWALVGVGGDRLRGHGLELSAGVSGFVVAGPAKSGRSTALVSIARSLVRTGAEVVLVCPRPSPLSLLAGAPSVVAVLQGAPSTDAMLPYLVDGDRPRVVIVDDVGTVARSEVDDALRDYVRSGEGRAVVVAGDLDELKNELRGVIVEARKAKAALLFSPSGSLDGDLVGLRIPRNLVGRAPAGRGLLCVNGTITILQVPLGSVS